MRDKPKAEATMRVLPTQRPSPPLVRAMANCICDHNINVLNGDTAVQVVLTLHRAGFSVKELEVNMDDAIMMASARQRNRRRKK